MCSGRISRMRATDSSHDSRVCCARPAIKSMLTLQNPASRKICDAAKTSARRCMRPAACNSWSLNDCTPRLMRLNPAAIQACAFSGVMVSGSASRVISACAAAVAVLVDLEDRAAGSANAKFWRSAQRIPASADGSSKLGVPPPKYTVSTAASRSAEISPKAPSFAISRRTAAAYGAYFSRATTPV